MQRVVVERRFESWREAARRLLASGQPPHLVEWIDAEASQGALEGLASTALSPPSGATVTVPRPFVAAARVAAYHRDPRRWELLYGVLWRMTHGERRLLEDESDPVVARLQRLVHQVRRDIHKMHAFVRFREVVEADGQARYIAWHRPDHFIVRPASAFFVERFRVMRWSILTPDETAHWDGRELVFGAGAAADDAPADDRLEDLWRTYYAAMFNPARVNPRAMTREMPVRHWATLPETALIPGLLANAPARVAEMVERPGAATSARPFVPADAPLAGLREAAASCRGCVLHASATQAVFGEGPDGARVMLVGEQPGDEEDVAGSPFVGPAGHVLNGALAEAGIDRATLYVTNAVKHFSFRREGKRRLHERPRMSDVRACRPWLEAEIERVQPHVIVCMGSTAAQALLGPDVRIQRDRGRTRASKWAPHVLVSYHPSAVLRAEDPAHAAEIRTWLVEDLRQARALSVESAPADRPPTA